VHVGSTHLQLIQLPLHTVTVPRSRMAKGFHTMRAIVKLNLNLVVCSASLRPSSRQFNACLLRCTSTSGPATGQGSRLLTRCGVGTATECDLYRTTPACLRLLLRCSSCSAFASEEEQLWPSHRPGGQVSMTYLYNMPSTLVRGWMAGAGWPAAHPAGLSTQLAQGHACERLAG
jgi:hypothetical protein